MYVGWDQEMCKVVIIGVLSAIVATCVYFVT